MVDQQLKPRKSALQKTPIAIIGLSALFAKSENLQQYWDNILAKINCISEVPETAWSLKDYYDPDPSTPDKTYARAGGFIPEIDFDPLEFGLPPDTLEALDSANLLSLVLAKQALKDAGYGEGKEFNRETTGVILGASGLWKSITPLTARLQYPVWEKVLKNSGLSAEQTEKIIEKMQAAFVPWTENSFPGMLPNVVAGRITNRLDLGGTNCVVDAACASSLSALTMAISELIEGRCDMMLTGGFDTDNSILNYMCFSKTPAFSKKDYLNPFDATSDGMMVGEGLGMLVIKRLADAERDGDRIYAVIKGIGTASDGRYKSIYAPRAEGQVRALRRAYEDAGFSPATLGLMEAHGTGTPAGDFCEFTALNQVLTENQAGKQQIALGSVKSQIGHTKAAAGAASLIKATLALHHKILPPTINVTQPNPKFKIEESPFYINTETRPWIQNGDTPRRAGVSSFGFGGTDYHVVLEEYTPKLPQGGDRIHSTAQSILLWADTPQQLSQKCQATLEQLQSDNGGEQYHQLQNHSKTALIPETSARVGFVATSLEEAQKLLKAALKQLQMQPQAEAWEHPQGIYYRQTGLSLKGKVVALFPGQGSQYLNMGREVSLNFPEIQQAYHALDQLMAQDNLPALSDVAFPIPAFSPETIKQQSQQLQRTENAQPAIGALSLGLYKILQKVGFKPDFVAGHSFGELTALWAAGVFSDEDYCYLIKARGQAMTIPQGSHDCDHGTMLAVSGDVAKIQQLIAGMTKVQIANYNAPEQVVLSGSKPEIAALEKVLSKQGYTVTPLPVSAAFHTPFVRHASQPFAEALNRVTFNTPQIPVYANMTGNAYPAEASAIRQLLEAHLLNAVQFVQEIENLYAQGGYCFVEIGPRQILTNLVKQTLGDRPHVAIALNPNRQKDSDVQLRQGVIQLRVMGLSLNDLDASPRKLPAQKSKSKGLSIKLNATNYISDKTKAAFEFAFKPEPVVQLASTPLDQVASDAATVVSDSPVQPLEASSNDEVAITPVSVMEESVSLGEIYHQSDYQFIISKDEINTMNNSTHNTVAYLFQQFYQHQKEMLQVHEQYVKTQSQSFQAFLQLLQQQEVMTPQSSTSAIAEQTVVVPAPVVEIPKTPVAPIVEPPKATPAPVVELPKTPVAPVVEPPKATPAPVAEPVHISHIANYLEPRYSAPTPQPTLVVTETASPAAGESYISRALMEVVSDKTGYPTEMLELEMDLEADLGVDSIKRVEIMGTLHESFPQLPKLSPEELAEKRTLGQIVQYLAGQIMVTEKKIA
ncbi:type I polyketide synthase [Nostoc parmelioides]|uniref:Acyltransferase domain-containing protein n=1 Tax=Nostoc parmelioides FACHB-3921 TaxID=2692909 RepID=A0ABR8BHS4_9NOSO|nr:type I polyketide synthase [Nostoc parmelioides]MBD2253239.1 acyltransferase domain-containing protein [Nostoc parmelioides FACHB-3921]